MGSWSFLYGSRAVFLDLESDPHLSAELEPQIRDMCLLRVRDHATCRCRGREDGEGKGWSREGGEGREEGAGALTPKNPKLNFETPEPQTPNP